jgi:hypothetical protein
MNEFQEKLKSLSFGRKTGQSERKVITDERDGSVAGVVTEHWDGSSDAAARPKSIRVKAQMLTEET